MQRKEFFLMCSSRYSDVFAVVISFIAGIVMALLSYNDLLTTGTTNALLALALGAFTLLLLVIVVTSLLRQNECYDRCIHQRGRRVLIYALLLIMVSAFALVFTLTIVTVTTVLIFLIYAFLTLTLLSAYCLLSCLIGAGRQG